MPDLTRQRLKDVAGLARKKHRDRLGQFLVEGVRSVESAVAAGAPLVEILVTAEARADDRVAALLARTDAPTHTVSIRDLDRVADTASTQGLVAVARVVPADASSLAGAVVALDGVQDPGNVGAIIRTAAWFGADAVLAGPGTADPFGPKVARAAMGGLWDLGLATTTDLVGELERLHERGHRIFAADLDGTPAAAWSPPPQSVLVLGSEAHGVSEAVRALLDGLPTEAGGRVRIGGSAAAQQRGVESLNVSVAAGVLLHRWLGA